MMSKTDLTPHQWQQYLVRRHGKPVMIYDDELEMWINLIHWERLFGNED